MGGTSCTEKKVWLTCKDIDQSSASERAPLKVMGKYPLGEIWS